MPLFGNLDANEGVDGKVQESASALKLSYPDDLPVSLLRQEILEAIQNHQVVVIAGAT
ncbi:MAG: hypothetical protein RL024_305, partial [Actinomycetota bacterium]